MNKTKEAEANGKRKGYLPSQAIQFIRKLLKRGVPPSFFEYNFLKEVDDIEFALVLGAVARIPILHGFKRDGYIPVALNWLLPKAKAEYIRMSADPYPSKMHPGEAFYLTQMQPELASTLVSIIEMKSAKTGFAFLREILSYEINEGEDPQPYLIEHKIGIGMAHGKHIIENFSKFSYFSQALNRQSFLNLPLFILLQYQAFLDRKEEQGTPSLAWVEVTIADERTHLPNVKTRIQFHTDLSTLIPQGAWVAVANIAWFKEEKLEKY